jgi:hypothetical protein
LQSFRAGWLGGANGAKEMQQETVCIITGFGGKSVNWVFGKVLVGIGF